MEDEPDKKLEFEYRRLEEESKLRTSELELERERFAFERRKRSGLSPLAAALLAGLVGLLGTVVGSGISGYSELRLARQEFESDLILKALNEDTEAQVRSKLQFLLDLELIEVLEGRLEEILEAPDALPSSSVTSVGPTDLTIKTGRDRYRIGETYTAVVEASEACYLYLYYMQADHFVALVGVSHNLEIRMAGDIQATEPPGIEMLVAFATNKPLHFGPKDSPSDVFRSLSSLGTARVTQAVKLIEVFE